MVTSTCSTKMYNHLTSKNHIHHTIPQKFLSYTPPIKSQATSTRTTQHYVLPLRRRRKALQQGELPAEPPNAWLSHYKVSQVGEGTGQAENLKATVADTVTHPFHNWV